MGAEQTSLVAIRTTPSAAVRRELPSEPEPAQFSWLQGFGLTADQESGVTSTPYRLMCGSTLLIVFNWHNYDPNGLLTDFTNGVPTGARYNTTGSIRSTPRTIRLSAGLRFGDVRPLSPAAQPPLPPPPPPPTIQTCADGTMIEATATCPVPAPGPAAASAAAACNFRRARLISSACGLWGVRNHRPVFSE